MQPDQLEFTRHVRSALASLYDPVALSRHPLASALAGAVPRESPAHVGAALRQPVEAAIESLKPAARAQQDSPNWRRYRILELRYLEAKDAGQVQAQLAMSKSQYYREHELAVEAIAELFWTHWAEKATAYPAHPSQEFADHRPEPRHNLLVQITSFIGREQELSQVQRLLQSSRLLTLTGVGGVGKTRLALRTAEAVLDTYPGGVWFVDLAAVVDGSFVARVAAEALGIRELLGESPLTALGRSLRNSAALLILDNCEHVLGSCVELVHALLSTCPHVRIPATSRELLGIGGETVWRVPPLGLPDPSAAASFEPIERSAAVALFIDRARAALPAFQLTEQNASSVATICRKVEGLPLALELAASRVELLSVDELARLLTESGRVLTSRDPTAPARQRTLRRTIEWSYSLLTEAEQQLFDRLSVFAGGWTLEAAQAVAVEDDADADAVVDLMAHLVDKSLVVAEPIGEEVARYRLLESLRQFGSERLAERGEQEHIRLRHVEYLMSLLDRADVELMTAAGTWLRRLELEHDNLRSALRWLIDRGDAEGAQRLAGAARRFWVWRGDVAEGRHWLAEALALDAQCAAHDPPDATASTLHPVPADSLSDTDQKRLAIRARALGGLGGIAYFQGDLDEDWRANSESLELCRKLGSQAGVARAMTQLGFVATDRGQFELARTVLQEAVALRYQPLEQADHHRAINLAQLGEVACQEGRYSDAAQFAEQGLALARSRGSLVGIFESLRTLGEVHRHLGQHDLARAYLEEGVATARKVGAKPFVGMCLTRLGRLAIDEGALPRAFEMLSESLRLFREFGDALAMARCLEAFAELAATVHEPEAALQLGARAIALFEAAGAPVPPTDRVSFDRALGSARESLDGPVAARAWTAGHTMPLDQLIAIGLRLRGVWTAPGAEPIFRQSSEPR